MRLLLIIWLSLPLALIGQTQQAENLTLLGAQRILNSSYQEAVQALNKAIQLNPNNWVAYEFRAQAHFQLDQKALALQDLDKAIRLHATNPELYFRRGILNEMFELYDEARRDYLSAIRFNGGTYESAEDRLAIIDDALLGDEDKSGRFGEGAVVSYSPYHFSARPFRYDTDRHHIQNMELDTEEERPIPMGNSVRTQPTSQATTVARKESPRAYPLVSTTYDPYDHDDKVFARKQSSQRTSSYNNTRGDSNQGIDNNGRIFSNSAPQRSFTAEIASPNKEKVLIDDVKWSPKYTEVHFRVYREGKMMNLPPDKLHLLVDGETFNYIPGSYRSQASVSTDNQDPTKFSVRFKSIPEGAEYFRVVSRGSRASEKWNYSFTLSPN